MKRFANGRQEGSAAKEYVRVSSRKATCVMARKPWPEATYRYGADTMNADLDKELKEHEGLATIHGEAMAEIGESTDLEGLEEARVKHLGRKSPLSILLRSIPELPPQEKPVVGRLGNKVRAALEQALSEKKQDLEGGELIRRLQSERVDITLPGQPFPRGHLHLITQTMWEIEDIFMGLGYAIAEGPEIETDYYNFTALNTPEGHPARSSHDTFFIEGHDDVLLRTHTSPVQIRVMEKQTPPIFVIAPGRVYRRDSDATHTPMFHQVEGLVIDRGIHMGHLKWTLETFLKAFFERDDVVLRLRPSYFPFTEPSAEVDVGYSIEKGRRVIGGSEGWMEVLGSGMVHPRVIAACGLDPDEWQGFAFGCGIDRLAMLKYGMDDLRAFFDGDLRWLRHYGFAALDVPTLSGGVGA